jgi:uncharacterized protein (DUF1810 family)
MSAEFDLERFVEAQDESGTYDRALAELRAGHKSTHWIWFVFPQLDGLGRSPTAIAFGIRSLAEARAYLEHPLLGSRMRECSQALLDLDSDSAEEVMGGIDAIKLRSCATLFAHADPEDPLFPALLAKFYEGGPDPATDDLLAG